MLVNHRYRFIFLKTRKTASTSHEIGLSKFAGANDIVTPIVPEDERTRRSLGFPGPRNHTKPFTTYGPKDVARLVLTGRRGLRYYNHMPAHEARAKLGDHVWNGYFTFCFERNPWDKVVSHFHWVRARTGRDLSLDAYLRERLHLRVRNHPLYAIEGEIAVDEVYRFEAMDEAFEDLRLHLGLPEPIPVVHAKTHQRTDDRPYYEILTEAQADLIRGDFHDEIELFGYTF